MPNAHIHERQKQVRAPARLPPLRDFALALLGALLLLALVTLDVAGLAAALPAWARLALRIPRLLLGVAYVLYVPGYGLTAALFPRDDDLDDIERLGLSLGLSVAWVPVLALILDRLPWGLRLWPILLGEIASVLLFAAVALWCRFRLPAHAANAPRLAWRPRPWWRSLSRLEKRTYLLCAGSLLVAGLAATWVFLVPSRDAFMTEFYVLGPEGLTENYPRQAASGQTLSVTMGLANRERQEATYTVEVWAVDPWNDREEQVNRAGPFTLPRGETLERPLTWHMPWPGDDQQVEFRLFRRDQENPQEPYRLLRLWLDVQE